MTKASDNVFPKLIGSEGAAPSTPAANTSIAYVKTDGLWYSKDDAGVETLMSSGPNTGLAAGTSFPGSPSTNDQFFRTDRGLMYYYDGTRWLSVTLYHTPFSGSDRGITTITATTSNYASATIIEDLYDIYLVDYCWQINVAATNNATHFWRWRLQKLEAVTVTAPIITSPDSSALATGWFSGRTAINAVHTDVGSLRTNAETNGSPGAFLGFFAITWRMVG